MSLAPYGDRGFSLTELMLTVAVLATLVATAVPVVQDVTANIKLNEAARTVERELQDARLRAVAANRPVRMRTNCPSVGMLRIVEVLGTEADAPVSRCDPAVYRFPPADQNIATRPNFDGAVKLLPNEATVSTLSIQFNPDGTAQNVADGVAADIIDPLSLTVSRLGLMRTMTVNALGKIQMQ